MKARDIMTRNVVTVSPDTPVRDIAALMAEKHISGVPVLTAVRVATRLRKGRTRNNGRAQNCSCYGRECCRSHRWRSTSVTGLSGRSRR
jgi:CBS domain-containing protein